MLCVNVNEISASKMIIETVIKEITRTQVMHAVYATIK